jgi:hypothetical protein
MKRLRLALSLLTVSAPASAAIVWRGDFETNDLTQWDYTQHPERWTFVTNPVKQGTRAGRKKRG